MPGHVPEMNCEFVTHKKSHYYSLALDGTKDEHAGKINKNKAVFSAPTLWKLKKNGGLLTANYSENRKKLYPQNGKGAKLCLIFNYKTPRK